MKIGFYLSSKHLGAWQLTNDPANEEGFNGTDSQFLQLAAQCVKPGDEVTLYCTNPPANQSGVIISAVAGMTEAVQAAGRDGYDVLIVNYKQTDDFYDGLAQAEVHRLKCVVWDQNGPTTKTRALYASLRYVSRLVCVSHFQALTTLDSPMGDKTAVIWNGVDSSFWKPDDAPRKRLVVYLGALVETKGFHHLAQAWPAVRAAVPDARLAVVGSAKLYDANARLGSLGVATPDFEAKFAPFVGMDQAALAASGVTFLGLQDKRSIRNLLHEASVAVINPNVRGSLECCSVGSLESMAAGAPVVGGGAGGLKETILPGQTGFLAKTNPQLSRDISRLLLDTELRDTLSKNSVRIANESFSREAFIANWRLLLTTLDDAVPPTLRPRFQSNPSLNAAGRTVVRAMKLMAGRPNAAFALEHLKRLNPLS